MSQEDVAREAEAYALRLRSVAAASTTSATSATSAISATSQESARHGQGPDRRNGTQAESTGMHQQRGSVSMGALEGRQGKLGGRVVSKAAKKHIEQLEARYGTYSARPTHK